MRCKRSRWFARVQNPSQCDVNCMNEAWAASPDGKRRSLRGPEALAAEDEGVRHGGAEVAVGPVHCGQDELGRAGVRARHRHVRRVRRVGEVHDDRHHGREVRRPGNELNHVLQAQLPCIMSTTSRSFSDAERF